MARTRSRAITKSLTKYHARLGYTYMPGVRLRMQGVSGGYLVRTNAAGYRSDREFVDTRRPGTFRALLYGDSQSAGDGIANALRYSDLIEAAVPTIEVDNYALSGSATDQQYLAWQEHGAVEHDLIVIGLYTENVRRITRRVVRGRDATGAEFFTAKPYYALTGEALSLHNVPVPRQRWTAETLPPSLLPHVYSYGEANLVFRNHSKRHESLMRILARLGPLRRLLKRGLVRLRPYQPLPDYERPDTPGWLLLRAILKAWIAASRTPVLIVLLPHESVLSGLSDPARCQERFRELSAETGCHLFDPLPALLALPASERSLLWSDAYGHLSAQGHAALAALLVPVVQRLMDAKAASLRAA